MARAVILTEAGKGVGFGHLTRCLALQRGLAEAGCDTRLIVQGDASVRPLLRGPRCALAEWRAAEKLPELLRGADIAVVDSYLAGPGIYAAVARRVAVPAYIDDNKRLRYPRGIVINGNPHAGRIGYPKSAGCPRLLGPRYALLRPPFTAPLPRRRRRQVPAVLITFGGQDQRELVPRILRALQTRFPRLSKRVVVGRSFHNLPAIRKAADARTRLVLHPDAAGMRRLMAASDVAVCSGGSTLNELARMGVPALAVVIADNQRRIARSWQLRGTARCCGEWDDPGVVGKVVRGLEALAADEAARARIGRLGRRQVDGRGARRVARRLLAAVRGHRTRVLFLTHNDVSLPLARWLDRRGGSKVRVWREKIDVPLLDKMDPEWIVSYNYRFLIPAEVLASRPGRFLNLHASLLPWNRGADPNLWSFLEGTPKGVTIHRIDPGMDTGAIVAQKAVRFDEAEETLASSYAKLHRNMQALFRERWDRIRAERDLPEPQKGRGSVHFIKDSVAIRALIAQHGWDYSIRELKARLQERPPR